MKTIGIIIAAVLAPSLVSGATLEPLEAQPDEIFPYRAAVLLFTNPEDQEITHLGIRWTGGGPRMIYPVSVPPGGEAKQGVHLPAVWSDQTYKIDLYSNGEIKHQLEAHIVWPAPLTTKKSFVDHYQCKKLMEEHTGWPKEVRVNTTLAVALTVIILACCLMIRNTLARTILLVMVICGFTVISWMIVGRLSPGYSTFREGEFLIFNCHYSSNAILRGGPGTTRPHFAPTYMSLSQMAEENMKILVGEKLEKMMRPGEVMIVRDCGRD